MELVAYIASAFIGIFLGVIGSGGSILTIPALVYLFGISPQLATSYSLFIVGVTSLVATISNVKLRLINYRIALLFGSTSVISVLLTRIVLVPIIPQHLFDIGGVAVTYHVFILSLFSILMIAASISMLGNVNPQPKHYDKETQAFSFKIPAFGLGMGLITGLLGAGGGFLIIPILMNSLHVKIKEAAAISLLIIALNSAAGFIGDLGQFDMDWLFLLKVTSLTILGSLVGTKVT
ncbi:MAG: sulfite exporter TauE/SafE family protein, partial [Pedobacter sp.]